MFWRKKQVFISYFCYDDSGKFYFGNTSEFATNKVTPEFLKYTELILKDKLEVKELVIIGWKYYE